MPAPGWEASRFESSKGKPQWEGPIETYNPDRMPSRNKFFIEEVGDAIICAIEVKDFGIMVMRVSHDEFNNLIFNRYISRRIQFC